MSPTETADLAGRVALVTGAGSGIGRSAARTLAAAGARIGALDRNAERAEAVVGEIQRAGGSALALTADVSAAGDMQRAIEALGATWDRIDILVSNAGVDGVWAPIDELEPEEWSATLDINLKGTYLGFHYAVPWLCRQGGAAVITSSVHGTRIFGYPGSTAYACAKAGQLAFARKMAVELAQFRVRVNAICPGYIATNIGESSVPRHLDRIRLPSRYEVLPIPLTGGQKHSPEEVARLILFLVSDAAAAITGSEVFIDGAQSLVVG